MINISGDKYMHSIYYVHLVGIKRSVQGCHLSICKTTQYILYSYQVVYFPYLKQAVYEGTEFAILINSLCVKNIKASELLIVS